MDFRKESYDSDCSFSDDPVYQALTMINFTSPLLAMDPLPEPVWPEKLKELEQSVVWKQDIQIEQLKEDLACSEANRKEAEQKLSNVDNSNKPTSETNKMINMGPFENKASAENMLEYFQGLSVAMRGIFDKNTSLDQTTKLLTEINSILKTSVSANSEALKQNVVNQEISVQDQISSPIEVEAPVRVKCSDVDKQSTASKPCTVFDKLYKRKWCEQNTSENKIRKLIKAARKHRHWNLDKLCKPTHKSYTEKRTEELFKNIINVESVSNQAKASNHETVTSKCYLCKQVFGSQDVYQKHMPCFQKEVQKKHN